MTITYVPPASTIVVRIDGEPVGKGRHRTVAIAKGKLRNYPDPKTLQAEADVIAAWERGGRRRMDGYVRAAVHAVMGRPQGHFRKGGDLSAAGLRSIFPTRKPDVDNLLKLALDALNDKAYDDDARVVDARVTKRWTCPGESPHTLVMLTAALPPSQAQTWAWSITSAQPTTKD